VRTYINPRGAKADVKYAIKCVFIQRLHHVD
jgi:hypothetical protein